MTLKGAGGAEGGSGVGFVLRSRKFDEFGGKSV